MPARQDSGVKAELVPDFSAPDPWDPSIQNSLILSTGNRVESLILKVMALCGASLFVPLRRLEKR